MCKETSSKSGEISRKKGRKGRKILIGILMLALIGTGCFINFTKVPMPTQKPEGGDYYVVHVVLTSQEEVEYYVRPGIEVKLVDNADTGYYYYLGQLRLSIERVKEVRVDEVLDTGPFHE